MLRLENLAQVLVTVCTVDPNYITPVNLNFGFESLTPDSMKTIKGGLWNITSDYVSNNLGIRHVENESEIDTTDIMCAVKHIFGHSGAN